MQTRKIRVIVRGGVVQDVQIDSGQEIVVEVYDYDIDGLDDTILDYDENGDACFVASYESR